MTHKRLPEHHPVPVSQSELSELIEFAGELVDASGGVILPHFRQRLAVDNKAAGAAYDPVTVADQAAERAIRQLIKARYPDHGIFGEEHGYEEGTRGLTWVIDPIDGTRAFITGIPLWGTLVALHDGRSPIFGVMDQPFTRERFTGSLNGSSLRTSQGVSILQTRPCASLAEARLQCTDILMFNTPERTVFEELSTQARLTRYSGDCYAYCMVALGCIDLVVESGLMPYDVQALIPIIENAGGVITNWSGGECSNGGQVIAAGDRRVHEQALQILASAAV